MSLPTAPSTPPPAPPDGASLSLRRSTAVPTMSARSPHPWWPPSRASRPTPRTTKRRKLKPRPS
eukprot:5005709-Lingulodinium_polyedra.AAC.1